VLPRLRLLGVTVLLRFRLQRVALLYLRVLRVMSMLQGSLLVDAQLLLWYATPISREFAS
jgi:hypothetical protein